MSPTRSASARNGKRLSSDQRSAAYPLPNSQLTPSATCGPLKLSQSPRPQCPPRADRRPCGLSRQFALRSAVLNHEGAKTFSRRPILLRAFASSWLESVRIPDDRPDEGPVAELASGPFSVPPLSQTKILSRKSVEYMTADHLGPSVDVTRLHEFAVEHRRPSLSCARRQPLPGPRRSCPLCHIPTGS